MEKFNEPIKVLDKGLVRLIDSMGSDLSIVRAARVSYAAEARAGEDAGKDEKLINYLMKNGHTSPFESCVFTFEVKAPIFVFRQWHRHRTWSFNEISARYAELPEEFYVPKLGSYGAQSASNKQMRDVAAAFGVDEVQATKEFEWEREQIYHMASAFTLYHKHTAEGMPRELARIVLPLATYSHMFATVDLLNLLKFIKLRSHEHAQHEIRVFSDAILSLVEPIVPVTVAAFKEYGL